MRKPIRAKAPRAQITDVYSMPAPVGGWNARDALADMPMGDAFKLINWFPTTADVVLRGGSSSHGTVTGVVETLAVYNEMDGTQTMFAVTDTDAYDVSSAGAGTAQSLTITDGKFQTVNFGDGTNNYLMMFNGADTPKYFNGTLPWIEVTGATSPAITGLTTTTIIQACVYKGRLIFVQKNSLSFWYLAAGAAGGGATEFDLSSYATKGGYLMWAATWSFDGGDGPDDAIAFMTSEGEVIVYRGTDPSTAANWVLAGVYFLGKPLGRRSFTKYGGDLVALTQNGAFPLSASLQSADINNTFALTNKIENAFNAASRDYGSNFGWEGIVYPAQSAIIFNIPTTEGSMAKQYVMNTITKSWCEFNSWNASCFVEYNKELYFGVSGAVYKAWTGTSDLGADIVAVGKTAFSYFGNTSQQKRFNFFRPMLRVNGTITFLTGMDVDFSDNPITGTSTYTVPSTSLWGTATWGTSYWGSTLEISRQWSSPRDNVGYSASGGVKVNTGDYEVRWISNDFVYERGGIL